MKLVLLVAAVVGLLGACGGGSGPETITTPTLPPTQSEAAAARNARQPAPTPTKPPETAAKPGPTADETIDAAVVLFMAAAAAVDGAAGDCSKMAAALNTWLDANESERNEVMLELSSIPEQQRIETFNQKMAKHRDKIEKLATHMEACEGDDEFTEAWQRLQA
jgi:hypothetical protein